MQAFNIAREGIFSCPPLIACPESNFIFCRVVS